MKNKMPTQIEVLAKVAYDKFNGGLIGCCEPSWEETDESLKLRMIESIEAVLQHMKEPTSEQYNALCNTGLSWREQNSQSVWKTYIDALLKD